MNSRFPNPSQSQSGNTVPPQAQGYGQYLPEGNFGEMQNKKVSNNQNYYSSTYPSNYPQFVNQNSCPPNPVSFSEQNVSNRPNIIQEDMQMMSQRAIQNDPNISQAKFSSDQGQSSQVPGSNNGTCISPQMVPSQVRHNWPAQQSSQMSSTSDHPGNRNQSQLSVVSNQMMPSNDCPIVPRLPIFSRVPRTASCQFCQKDFRSTNDLLDAHQYFQLDGNIIPYYPVQCDAHCKNWFHLACSGLTIDSLSLMKADSNIEWLCNMCTNNLQPNIPYVQIKM